MSENQTNPVEEEERHRFRLMELENMIREHLRTGKFFLVGTYESGRRILILLA